MVELLLCTEPVGERPKVVLDAGDPSGFSNCKLGVSLTPESAPGSARYCSIAWSWVCTTGGTRASALVTQPRISSDGSPRTGGTPSQASVVSSCTNGETSQT